MPRRSSSSGWRVQKLPQDPEVHYALGSLLMYEKKYPESQQELLIAIKLKPDLAMAYGNLAIVAAENKQYPLALQALDARAKYLPGDAGDLFPAGDNLRQLERLYPRRWRYYQRFLAVDGGKFPDQEWQARHRLIALDPQHADKYRIKK